MLRLRQEWMMLSVSPSACHQTKNVKQKVVTLRHCDEGHGFAIICCGPIRALASPPSPRLAQPLFETDEEGANPMVDSSIRFVNPCPHRTWEFEIFYWFSNLSTREKYR